MLKTFGEEHEPLEVYSPQKDFLGLLNTGNGRCIGGKLGFTFSGRWVWKLKDYIDSMFMNLYGGPTLLGAEAFSKYQEFKEANQEHKPTSTETIKSLMHKSKGDYSVQFGHAKDDTLEKACEKIDTYSVA